MPRKGKTTISNTSMDTKISVMIDKWIDQQKNNPLLPKLSRAKVVEIAVYKYLDSKGVLDSFLASVGCLDSDVKKIRQYLEVVS